MLARRVGNFLKTTCETWSQRFIHLQEYQSKFLLQSNGVNVQKFIVALSVEEAKEKIKELNASEYVVKAQILAGGRGRGQFMNFSGMKGGIKLTNSKEEAMTLTARMLGNNLSTKQTPENGVMVQRVMIAEAVDITSEKYLAFLNDRSAYGHLLICSPYGGMDIEEIARTNPDKIYKLPIDVNIGFKQEQALDIAQKLGFTEHLLEEATDQIMKIYRLFNSSDATLFEINPISEIKYDGKEFGKVICVDAKFHIDDNAKYRQKEIFDMDGHFEEDPVELEANEWDLNYIKLDGNIACLVNGAGLAMATMDMITHHGGQPANFLDVGGGVNVETVLKAFQIILDDKQAETILVNIFGGIVDCIPIAEGLIASCNKLDFNIPLVVRLEGTNVIPAKALLEKSNLNIIYALDMDDACRQAVICANKRKKFFYS